jgi:hypothetical protein
MFANGSYNKVMQIFKVTFESHRNCFIPALSVAKCKMLCTVWFLDDSGFIIVEIFYSCTKNRRCVCVDVSVTCQVLMASKI